MRTGLGVEDLDGLLDEPLVAVLATLRRDGSVLLSPVWHRWRDGGFDLWLPGDDVKVRHLRRDPRATVVVAESDPPLRGVEVRGTARIVEASKFEIAFAVGRRYVDEERARAYVGTDPDEFTVVRLEPGDLRAWDFADEYEAGDLG
jgi:PPOX class probable F420-dependent enzyme